MEGERERDGDIDREKTERRETTGNSREQRA